MASPINPYRTANQLRKALKIILTILTGKGDMTGNQVRTLDDARWRIILVAADVKDASDETRELVAQGLEMAADIKSRTIPVSWVRAIIGDVSLMAVDPKDLEPKKEPGHYRVLKQEKKEPKKKR